MSPTKYFCMGEMRSDPNAAWMNQNEWYSQNNHFKELNRIDGMPTEFEWKIFPGFTTLGLLEKIHDLTKDLQCGLEQFNDRIIYLSMYNDIVWRENGNTKECNHNFIEVSKSARRFRCSRWSFLEPGSEKKRYKNCSDKPDGNLDRTAEMMILKLSTESGRKEHGKQSTQFNYNERNIEMLLHTVICVNQLSIHRALADLCKELDNISSEDSAEDSSEDSESPGTLCAKEILEMRQ